MLAVLGGTFDPIHFGHLRVAWEASEALDCELRLMPSAAPPHRPQPLASTAHRVAMLERALEGQTRLGIERAEIERGGTSYMVDTLCALRAREGAERPIVLVLGSDAFAGLASWHRWSALFGLAHLAVLNRGGQTPLLDAELAAEWFARRVDSRAALVAAPAGAILPIKVSALEISASAVRALLASRRAPRYLVPDAVFGYIDSAQLYAHPPDAPRLSHPGSF